MKKGYNKPILSITELNENIVLTNSGLNDSFNKSPNEIETNWGEFWS